MATTAPSAAAAMLSLSTMVKRTSRQPAAGEPRAIVVHSLAHARAALAAAGALDCPVALWSAPGAAAYAGAGWFLALIEQARRGAPGVPCDAVLDCADLPGLVLGAFRIGVETICFTGSARVAAKLADIAAQQGGRLLRRRPAQALDLWNRADPAEACRAWLSAN